MITHELKFQSDIYMCNICGGVFGTDVSDEQCSNPIWYQYNDQGDKIEIGRKR